MNNALKKIIVPFAITLLQATYPPKILAEKYTSWNKRFPDEQFEIVAAANYSLLKKFHRADKIYDNILRKNPESLEALVNRGIILYENLGQHQKALRYFLKALSISGIEASKSSIIYAHLGTMELKNNNDYDAEKNFLNLVTYSNDKNHAIQFIFKQYKNYERYSSLLKTLEKIAIKIPGIPGLHATMGEVLAEKLNKPAAAIEKFEEAIILAPNNTESYVSLGLAYYKLKDYQRALNSFDSALNINPNDALSLYNKACVLALTNRSREALLVLDRAIKINPGLQETAINDKDLASIKDLPNFKNLTRNSSRYLIQE